MYHTRRFDETAAFWKGQLGLEEVNSWDRGDDRGAMFAAADAIVEILYFETARRLSDPVYLIYEVDNVDEWHARAIERGASPGRFPEDMAWGHREASLVDPNGLVVTAFSKLPNADI
jgi:catechol 2,3-dioxygenase-like lactoylglutathione lyase family enzyme